MFILSRLYYRIFWGAWSPEAVKDKYAVKPVKRKK